MRHHHLVAASLALLGLALVVAALRISGGTPASATSTPPSTAAPAAPAPTDPTTPAAAPRVDLEVPEPAPSGEPWGSVVGLLQFRGNPMHTWYGAGPVPHDPAHAWRYPDAPMCSTEVVRWEERPVTDPETGEQATDPETGEPVVERVPAETKRWCGTGWTGQPLVWERPDGVTEVVFGGYDGHVHFVDGDTGQPTRPPFRTGFMIKGTGTIDPDGFPILYIGSRDGFLRAIALDRPEPTELWRLGRHPRGVWNDDWDGNPSVVDGILHVGGEDSWYRAVELNRAYGPDGLVTVAPEVLVEVAGWSDEQVRATGDWNVSIENSVVVDVERDRVYFANSGGRVVGLDISRVREGEAPVVFDWWVGDDVDGSIVLDHDGTIVVPVEYERKNERGREVGQLVKLDPWVAAGENPLVWSVHVPDDPRPGVAEDDGGIWATPALHAGHLYVTTHPGDLLVVDAATGRVTHTERFGYHEWSSPVVVDDTLVVARCLGGGMLAWSLADPASPTPLWEATLPSGSCIESTPAVWKGRIWVGSRDGYLHAWR